MSTPATIKNHRYGKLYSLIYNEVRERNGIVSIVFCGKRGVGKTYSMSQMARLLDRGKDDVCRFEAEDVKLDPVDFFTALTGDYPRGKVICLDDAGLHMYKSDALSDILKRVSKVLQNIRYKHPIIMLSLPYFGQLMKDAREMTDIYIEMKRVEAKINTAFGLIQTLKISSFTGDLYRYTVLQSTEVNQPKFHFKFNHWNPEEYGFDKPPTDFLIAYERIKRKALDKINREHLMSIKEQREVALHRLSSKKMGLPEAINYCRERLDKFKDATGKVNSTDILLEVDEFNKPLFGMEKARIIAKYFNTHASSP